MSKLTPEAPPPDVAAPESKAPPRPQVVLTRRGARRMRGSHPWIYRSDVGEVRAEPGDIVRILGPRGRELGHATYSSSSQIALRRVADRGPRPDEESWRERLRTAIRYRQSLGIDADAYRLVHAEGDRIPGLIVDRYGNWLVVQLLSQAMDRLRPMWVAALEEALAPAGIVARHDARVRSLEGLERGVEVLTGNPPERVTVRDGRIHMEVDLHAGQKTGLFLDQRENRAAARRYASGRLLDCFSYTGAFALQLADRCEHVTALDISEEAVEAIGRNAALNDLEIDARCVNVFDELRARSDAGEKFDTIVLDPPAFAKNKRSIRSAVSGYKEINLRAIKLLRAGGVLVTSSCSYHVDEPQFLEIVAAAAGDVGAEVSVIERRGQGRDHPVRVGMPEGSYLKCLILRKL